MDYIRMGPRETGCGEECGLDLSGTGYGPIAGKSKR